MKKAFILFGIAFRNMMGYSYSPKDIKAEAELVNELLK